MTTAISRLLRPEVVGWLSLLRNTIDDDLSSSFPFRGQLAVEQHIQLNNLTLHLGCQKIPTICRKCCARHYADPTLPMRSLL